MKKVKVQVSFFVEVELDDEGYERRHFILEDNGCPGTGIIGKAVTDLVNEESDTCWACRHQGENKIIEDNE